MSDAQQFPPKGTRVRVVNAEQHSGKTGRIEGLDDYGTGHMAKIRLDDGQRVFVTDQNDIEPEVG